MSKSGEPPDLPTENFDPGELIEPWIPLHNLSAVKDRIDTVHRFLSQSISCNIIIPNYRMETISSEISAAIHQIIVNGAALLSSFGHPRSPKPAANSISISLVGNPNLGGDEDLKDCDLIELDAVELLAEHAHFCQICHKGFKRDANLRMHMRAHGDRYKTPEALTKPPSGNGVVSLESHGKTRFSCPFEGCNRNRRHERFKPLKSAVCARNHFKRSHCPKMYSCQRCRTKSFSVLADLKSHLKRCVGDLASASAAPRWWCSCGTSFSRKDEFFGHVAIFEGHMPAAVFGQEKKSEVAEEGDERLNGALKEEDEGGIGSGFRDDGFSDGLLVDGFYPIGNYSLLDIL